jgi:RHS repeat-associated protein
MTMKRTVLRNNPVPNNIQKTMNRIGLRSIVCLLLTACLFIALTDSVRGQNNSSNVQFTQGNVSDSAVFSMDVPLMNYKGRGIDLPVSLSYSSSTWSIEHINVVNNYNHGYTGLPANSYIKQSTAEAIYSKYSTSGWKSSLDLPKIEWPKSTDMYDYKAKATVISSWPGGCSSYRISKVFIHMPDGSTHELRESDDPYTGAVDMSGTFYAVDGSRIRFDATGSDTGTIYMPDGKRYVLGHPTSTIYDSNGNHIDYSESTGKWTDVIGREILNPIPANPAAQDYTYNLPGLTGVNSGLQTYTFRWKELDDALTPVGGSTPNLRYVAQHYLPSTGADPTGSNSSNYPQLQSTAYSHLFSAGEPGYEQDGAPPYPVPTLVVGKGQSQNQLFNPIVLSEIVLPDGSSYKFTYNVYGEIDKVVYPTGAYEKYEYAATITPSEGYQSPFSQADRNITSRKQSTKGDGSDILEWTYVESQEHDSAPKKLSIIAPDKTRSEIFTLVSNYSPQPLGYTDARAGSVIEKRFYSTSSTGLAGDILRREMTEYSQATNTYSWDPPCNGTAHTVNAYRNARPVKTVSIIFEGSGPALAQTITYTYDTTYQMTTGVDQVTANTYQYAVISNNSSSDTAQAGTISQISSGGPVSSTETTYSDNSTYRSANILGLPVRVKIYDSSGSTLVSQIETIYDESNYSPGTGRALPTSEKSWDNTKGTDPSNSANYITVRKKFDTYGNPIEVTDARNNITTTIYDSTYHTYPVSITSPVPDDNGTYGSNTGLTASASFDPVTGLILSTADANGQTSTTEYNDPLLRPTKKTASNGQQTIIEYGVPDTNGVIVASQRFIKIREQLDESRWSESYKWSDGSGRLINTRQVDAGGDVFVDTEYDDMGRLKKVSNPYRTGETIIKTENFYDDSGRIVKVKTPDNAEVVTSYGLASSGNQIGTTVTFEDQADKLRRNIFNVQEQLIRADEPTDSGGLGTVSSPNRPTVYGYNTLGSLTTVTQESQTRTFTYSSLSRLLSVAEPESGTISYQYDNNGNLTQKSQARSGSVTVTTSNTYDRLNRLVQTSYAGESGYATPTVTNYYDKLTNARGKLIKISSSVSTTEYTAFDVMGQPTAHKQTTDGTEYNTAYVYNLKGALIEETYPSTRKVNMVLDSTGNLSAVQSKKTSTSGYWKYADNFSYNSSGTVTSLQRGNGHWESATFNSRRQATQISLGLTPGGDNLLKLNYSYGTTANNGNLLSQTITVPSVGSTSGFTAVQNYTYDSTSRLKQADEKPQGYTQTDCNNNPGKCWQQTFTYDRYGNRNFDEANTTTLTKSCGTSPNFTVCPVDRKVQNPEILTSNNRIKGDQDGDYIDDYTFDSAGNTTKGPGSTFVYDGDNNQVEIWNGTQRVGEYWYDGEGKRVKKKAYQNGQVTETTVFVYDASGRLVGEYSTLLNPSPQVSYLTEDYLGSPRINTNENGAVISRHDYRPFGEEISSSQRASTLGYTADDNRKQFTGYERDDESGLDFAQARYSNSTLGRFTSPDPFKIVAEVQQDDDKKARSKLAAYLSKPQQWNRFVYTINNPLKYTDPTGEVIYLTGDTVAERNEALQRLKGVLGEERYNLCKSRMVKIDGKMVMEVTISDGNAKKMSEMGNDADSKAFSAGMATMLNDKDDAFEFKVVANDAMIKTNTGDESIAKSGGGRTLSSSESPTGRIQIFVARDAARIATEDFAKKSTGLSNDGKHLTYNNNNVVDAHEFGHTYGMFYKKDQQWKLFENTRRKENGETQMRLYH